jgi:hypothetical protein
MVFNFEFEILISKQYSVEAGNHGSVSLVLDSFEIGMFKSELFSLKLNLTNLSQRTF